MNILELSDDLQWRILLLNADMDAPMNYGALYEPGKGPPHFRYSPLTVTRRTSQVCRTWRHLLLDSPSIRGRVLHLDFLNQRTADWRLEVLRRTGQSPLCIAGEAIGVMMEDFFFALLDDHWSRIRRINVRIHNEWEFEDDVWEPLTRPTSVLESFNLSLCGETSFPSKFKTKLFGNKAPSLAEFHPNNIKFSLQAPWVSQLRCLEVSHSFTVQEIIETIGKMPFLDTIILGVGVRPIQPSLDDIHQVFLPSLTKIKLSCPLETGIQFLEHVAPSKGCGLSFTTSEFRLPTQENELEACCRVLAQYAENYFSAYPPKTLRFNLDQWFCTLCLLELSPEFYIRLEIRSVQPQSRPIFSRILTSVSSLMINGVTTLDLLMNLNSMDLSDANIIRTLYSFTSLEVLRVRSFTLLPQLQLLSNQKSGLLFPKLRTLTVIDFESGKIAADIFRPFLSWREMIGVPIQTLDLTYIQAWPYGFGDLGCLEEFHVKVIWLGRFGHRNGKYTTEEYTCPGGNPSRLDFRLRRYVLV